MGRRDREKRQGMVAEEIEGKEGVGSGRRKEEVREVREYRSKRVNSFIPPAALRQWVCLQAPS